MIHEYRWELKNFFPIIRYHPCIKYQIPADPEIDGTDTFIVAESMKFDLSRIKLWNSYKQVFPDLNLEPNQFSTPFFTILCSMDHAIDPC